MPWIVTLWAALAAWLTFHHAPAPRPTPTPVPIVTAAPTPTSAPTAHPTPIATIVPTPTPAPTLEPTATPAPTATPTLEPTPVPTVTPTLAPTPTPAPTYAPTISATHVLNFDYQGSLAAAQNCAKVAAYLSYDYPKGDQVKTWHACGVKTIDYISPSMPQGTEYEHTSIATFGAQAKDCSGNVITTYNGTGYLADPHAAGALAYFKDSIAHAISYTETYNNGQKPDVIFLDNSLSIYGASAQPCSWAGQADWSAAYAKIYAQLDTQGVALIVNADALPTAYVNPPAGDTIANMLAGEAPSTITGGMLEGFVWNNQNATGYTSASGAPASAWQAQQDSAIAHVSAGKVFNPLSNGRFTTYESDPTSAAGIAARLYVYASFMLTYDPKLSLFGEELHTASGYNEMPESDLVPLYPLETAHADITELQAASNAPYVRQFAACYYLGGLIGPCAAVVNPSSSIVSVTLPQYAHSIVLAGSDVFDGGSLSTQGPAVTQLGPKSAAILTQ